MHEEYFGEDGEVGYGFVEIRRWGGHEHGYKYDGYEFDGCWAWK